MKVRCLFFAESRELVGEREVDFDVNEGTDSNSFLHDYLLPRYPDLQPLMKVRDS